MRDLSSGSLRFVPEAAYNLPGMIPGPGLIAGGVPGWVMRTASGVVADWHADWGNNRYWFDGTEYPTIATFFTAFGTTFARSGSVATFVGSNKLIQTTSGNDVPRLTHDPATGAGLGFLTEPARTNRIADSEEVGGASWFGGVNVDITANDTTAPDGTSTADRIDEDTTNGEHKIGIGFPALASDAVAGSFFVKDAGRGFMRISLTDGATFALVTFVDMTDGTFVDTIGEAGDWTNTYQHIVPWDDGWHRVTLGGNIANNRTISFDFSPSTDGTTINYQGVADTPGLYIWGVQGEAQATGLFSTSYISTSGGTITRAAESAVSTFADTPNIPFKGWSTTAGTMVAQWRQRDVEDTVLKYVYICQDAGDDDDESVLCQINLNDIKAGTTDGGTGSLIEITDSAAFNTSVRSALSWVVNNTAHVVDAATVTVDDAATIPVCTRMFWGNSSGADVPLAAPITEHAYFNTNVSDSELDTLSTLV